MNISEWLARLLKLPGESSPISDDREFERISRRRRELAEELASQEQLGFKADVRIRRGRTR